MAEDERPERMHLACVAGVAELGQPKALLDGEQHGVVVRRASRRWRAAGRSRLITIMGAEPPP